MQIDCVSRHDNEAKGNWDDNSSNSQFYQLYNEIAKFLCFGLFISTNP